MACSQGNSYGILSYNTIDAWSAHDPLLATSQHNRETRPWYVCPRDPFTEGFKCDMSAFFNPKRRLGDSPGKWIAGGFYYGLVVGGLGMIDHHSHMSNPKGPKWKNKYLRLDHQWASKRLGFVLTLRPAVVFGSAMAAYWIPRELFSQNFGRRNKRNYYDWLPNAVGACGAAGWMYYLGGNMFARPTFWSVIVFNSLFEWLHSAGFGLVQTQRENLYPVMMSAMYGLPNGGEGFDQIAGGEHGKEWRMESNTEAGYLQFQKAYVRQSPNADNHPKLRYDWGHMSYCS